MIKNMLGYPIQNKYDLLGTRTAPVTLTANYSDNVSSPVLTKHMAEQTLFVDYTPADAGSYILIKLEASQDEMNVASPMWSQELFEAISGGTATDTPGERKIVGITGGVKQSAVLLIPPNFPQDRVSVKEVKAGANFGTASISTIVSGI